MARVSYGVPVTDLTGSVGGVTFQKNASGSICRLKPRATQNPSAGQALQQGYIAQLNSLWPLFDSGRKDGWNALAAAHTKFSVWGREKTLNGFQWFVSCNLNNFKIQQGIIYDAPSYSSISPPQAFTLVHIGDYLYIDFGSTYTPAPLWLVVFVSLPLRQSSLKLRRSKYLIIRTNSFSDQYLFITSEVAALYGVDWHDFQASANCTIIANLQLVEQDTGMSSMFTSGLCKIQN